jgi:hypothetical protein
MANPFHDQSRDSMIADDHPVNFLLRSALRCVSVPVASTSLPVVKGGKFISSIRFEASQI